MTIKQRLRGKRLHSNIPLAWLNYPDWQVGYGDILRHQEQHQHNQEEQRQ